MAAASAIAVAVAGSMLLIMLQGVYLGRGDIRSFTKSETTPRVLLAIIALAIVGLSAENVASPIWAYSAAFAVAACLGIRLALTDGSPLRPRLGLLGKLFGYGAAFALNLFLITLCSRVSMFIISHNFDATHAGRFFAAIRINDIVLEAATAVGLVVFSKAVKE